MIVDFDGRDIRLTRDESALVVYELAQLEKDRQANRDTAERCRKIESNLVAFIYKKVGLAPDDVEVKVNPDSLQITAQRRRHAP